MKTIDFKAINRTESGKKAAKAARRNKLVPCVIYGGGDNVHFSVSEKEIRAILYTPNSYIINFDIEGKKETVVMREVQYHPVFDQILHIDFYRVQEGKPVIVNVPIELTGVSAGVKEGGKIFLSARKVKICGLVEKLPDSVKVDVTDVKLGGSVFVGHLSSEDYSFVTPASTAICSVQMTRAARGDAAKGDAE
ncbi:MAG: 50S ribosomal protein L25/general stress protein Ctc [Bacteroidetes bacterium]|nr:50S ribosomal protein L25/general stress protein Ctc [Bacteroidota bacterium]